MEHSWSDTISRASKQKFRINIRSESLLDTGKQELKLIRFLYENSLGHKLLFYLTKFLLFFLFGNFILDFFFQNSAFLNYLWILEDLGHLLFYSIYFSFMLT